MRVATCPPDHEAGGASGDFKKFGPQFAAQLRKREPRRGRVWHLDEKAVPAGGKQHWLWRAVDEHGATLDVLLQEQRDTEAAERFFQMLLGHAGAAPERISTDKLGSYAAAIRQFPELVGVDHQQVRSAMRCTIESSRHTSPPGSGTDAWPHLSSALPRCVHPYVESVPPTSPLLHRARVLRCAPGALRSVAGRGRVAPVIRPGEVRSTSGAPSSSARLLKLTQPSHQGRNASRAVGKAGAGYVPIFSGVYSLAQKSGGPSLSATRLRTGFTPCFR